ncbi:MAG: PilZ domain-containing protein [Acidobacteria bacterium]|nr:PilZ domain-containing protein [Acidobacteriota bacterium]
MTIQTRVSQDRRNASRIMSRLECNFTFEGKQHKAMILDLSMKGAFLSSAFMPPNGSHIIVEIQQPGAKKDLIFNGTVIRGNWGHSEHGRRGRFGIRFPDAPIGLLALISKLYS